MYIMMFCGQMMISLGLKNLRRREVMGDFPRVFTVVALAAFGLTATYAYSQPHIKLISARYQL